jgi:hypothetical protein
MRTEGVVICVAVTYSISRNGKGQTGVPNLMLPMSTKHSQIFMNG